MSSESYEIPRHGNAGVAFLGVELGDAMIVIASVFAGLGLGVQFGVAGYLGVPVAGFFLNKLYIDWRANSLPGQLRTTLFGLGVSGYGRAFTAAAVVYRGDATVINPSASTVIDQAAGILRHEEPRTWN